MLLKVILGLLIGWLGAEIFQYRAYKTRGGSSWY